MADAPDCRTCGACCAGTTDATFAMPITKDEARQLPRHMVGVDLRIPELPRHRRSLRVARTANQCIALRGVVGEACTCTVYSRRPEVCRVFPAGGEHCHAARAAVGISNA